MPVYPEKLTNRQETRGAISSQFWGQHVQSTRSIDGQAQTLPCEPPPLALSGDSGLNRMQQLLAAQAIVAPAIPSYSAADGGVVLDRVMLRTGSKSWWAALAARARAQRIFAEHRRGRELGDALRDLNNYSLSARARTGLGRNATGNLSFEIPNAHEFTEEVRERGAAAALMCTKHQPIWKGLAELKYQLPGHEVRALATRSIEYLDSAATYCWLPSAMSLDLASLPRSDGIQYRAGVHQVTAPPHEPAHGASQGAFPSGNQLESSLHFQGAVAVEGEATLWRASADGSAWPQNRRNLTDSFEGDLQEPADWANFPQEGAAEDSSANSEGVSEGKDAEGTTESASQAPQKAHHDTVKRSKNDFLPNPPARSAGFQGDGWSWRQPIDWQQELGLRGGGEVPEPATSGTEPRSRNQCGTLPAKPRGIYFACVSSAGWGVSPLQGPHPWEPPPEEQLSKTEELRRMLGSGPLLEGVDASGIQKGIVEARKVIDKTRQSAGRAAREVASGLQSYQRQNANFQAGRARRAPYSPLLAEPHIKVNGAVGCLARVPLPRHAFTPSYNQQVAAARSGAARDAESSTTSQAPELPGLWSQELWAPYLRDTALRVFASCGVSAQAGRFRKKFADYTAASIRLDCGLASPEGPSHSLSFNGGGSINEQAGASLKQPTAAERVSRHRLVESVLLPEGSRCPILVLEYARNVRTILLESSWIASEVTRCRAFALEGRGIWHAASISLGQQVWGPLRARLDTRLALDVTEQGAQERGSRPWLSRVAGGAPWLQPVKLESVWGLDLVVPGSGGSARAIAWFSPTRREGMLELRLF